MTEYSRTLARAGTAHELSVSVVVCCHSSKRWQRLVSSVASLREQTAPAEIVVVVDHCAPLEGRARSLFPQDVLVVANSERPGLSGARNTGLLVSRGDVVAFLDDDAVAEPGWLAELLAAYDDPRVLGVGGHVEPSWPVSRPSWFPPEFDWVIGCSHPGRPVRRDEVRDFVGANMSFRREILTGVGGFRTEFGGVGDQPASSGEIELCARLAQRYPDGVLLYQPAAGVRQHVPPERATWAYFTARCRAEGLSRAAVSDSDGHPRALDTEREYVRRVLPAGIAHALRAAVFERDLAGLARAGASLGGLAATCAGYAAVRVRQARTIRSAKALAVLLIALTLWAVSLRSANPRAMNDFGLLSILPPTYWMGFALIVGGAVVLNHRGNTSGRVLAAYLTALIVQLHGTPAILYGSPRYSWSWKHLGIVDFITRRNMVDPAIGTLSAYHGWPGFFSLNAGFVDAGGLTGALNYAAWAPPVFALLAFPPLRLLYGTLVPDRRQVWFGLLFFYLANWVGQEYFSPQAFAFVLYLTVLAVCLAWLPAGRPVPRWARWLGGGVRARKTLPAPSRRGVLAVVVLLLIAVVSSHQLTPFMLLSALTCLVVTRQIRPAWLLPLLVALTAAWDLTVAEPFLKQNLYWIVESIGQPTANTQSNLVDLSNTPYAQKLVGYADRSLTGAMYLLAGLGWLRGHWTRSPRMVPVLLALSPFPLLVANNYGGEMLFRIYLFGLPGLALLTAGLVYPQASTRLWRAVFPAALAVAVTISLAFAYYGKERANYFTSEEIEAEMWLYDNAPPRSLLIGATPDFPWAFRHYEQYDYTFLENLSAEERRDIAAKPTEAMLDMVGDHPGRAFLILTRSEDVSARYTGLLRADVMPRLRALAETGVFQVVYRNPEAVIVEVKGAAS